MSISKKQYIFIRATALLSGTIIGAGILAIPYAVYEAGYWLGILYIIILGIVMMFLHLMLGEISLRTRGFLDVPELIHKYLGKKGHLIALGSLFIIIYGALTAYIRAAGDIISSVTVLPSYTGSMIFFIIGGYLALRGLKVVSKWELVFGIGMILIIATLWLKALSINGIDWTQFQLVPFRSLSASFSPYGVILFAYSGLIAIPYIKKLLGKQVVYMKSVIKLGFLIPLFLYSLFVTLVIGVSGVDITPVATVSLGQKLGGQALVIINIFALLAISTSFIMLGRSLIESYMSLGKIHRHTATIATFLPPMGLVLVNGASFNSVLNYAGGIGVSILSILIVLTFWRSKRIGKIPPAYSLGHVKWVGIIMITMFFIGMVSLFF